MKKYGILLISIIITISFFMISCGGPKEDAKEVLNIYYQNIKDNKAEETYDTLCEQSKKDSQKEDFIRWQNVAKEVYTLEDFKIEKVKEFKGSLDGIGYKNISEFNVNEKGKNLYENKETSIEHKIYVVNDDGKWKIYLNKKAVKQLASNDLTQLARMYISGSQDKQKDLNKAISILKEASEIDADNKDASGMLMRAQQMKAATSLK